ncbi:MAG: type II/IV secretion system protein, partial [Lacisediminimonas sp.]|nr:type II/IV secretion system protein [Lacisediminimonas sp.]
MNQATRKALDLQHIFSWLLKDKLVDKDDARALYNQAQALLRKGPATMHPLTAVAQCKIRSIQPARLMTLDWLSEWLAAKVELPFIRIDPLKIDFTRVADVMSATYAARFNILPVELTATELTIATAEP